MLTAHKFGGKRFYREKPDRLDVIEYLAGLGVRVAPQMRTFILRKNPVDAMVGEELRVRSTGSGNIGGSDCDLIEIQGPTIHQSIAIRRRDHLLATATTENLDGRTVVASS